MRFCALILVSLFGELLACGETNSLETGYLNHYNRTFCHSIGLCHKSGSCSHSTNPCASFAHVLCTCGSDCCMSVKSTDGVSPNGGYRCDHNSKCPQGKGGCRRRYCPRSSSPVGKECTLDKRNLSREDCESRGCCYNAYKRMCYFAELPKHRIMTARRPKSPPAPSQVTINLQCSNCQP